MSGAGAWFLKLNVNTRFTCWTPSTPYIHTRMFIHRQLTLPFEGPAGLDSCYRQSCAAWWELQNTGLPSKLRRILIINALVWFSLFKQTPGWSSNQFHSQTGGKRRSRVVCLRILWLYKYTELWSGLNPKCLTPFGLCCSRHEENQ